MGTSPIECVTDIYPAASLRLHAKLTGREIMSTSTGIRYNGLQ